MSQRRVTNNVIDNTMCTKVRSLAPIQISEPGLVELAHLC